MRRRLPCWHAGVVALVLTAGCTSITGGDPAADRSEAPVYRSSVTASVAESAATSSAQESKRQASLTTAAIHTACETLSTTSADSVDAVNKYVDAINGQGPDDPLAAAIEATVKLDDSADRVAADSGGALPQDIADGLKAWSDAARGAGSAIADRLPPDQFNIAIRQLNDARSNALNLCDASY